MTCIAAIARDGKVVMGSDSCASNTWDRQVIASKKIVTFTVSGSDSRLLVGSSGSIRFINILRHSVRLPADNTDDAEHWLVTEFVPAVRAQMSADGWTETNNGRESGGNYSLLAYRGRLFEFEANWQMLEPASGMAATGSGYPFALGAMHATSYKALDKIVTVGLEAAERFTPSVMAPFHLEEA